MQKAIKKIKQYLGVCYRKLWLTLNYIKYFSLKQEHTTKTIVVCFDGLVKHGGLVDRLKGIVSFYHIAKHLGYKFQIVFHDPFELSTLLEPNLINWKPSRLKWHPIRSKILYLVNNFEAQPLALIQNSKAQTFYVYANIDYSVSIFPEIAAKQHEVLWREAFHALFKKSRLLEERLKMLQQQNYIAFHTRFTSILGDFRDTNTNMLSKEAQEHLKADLKTAIAHVTAKVNKEAYIFSDSINFITFITQNSNLKSIPGQPLHMDNLGQDNKALDGHLKTLIDFFMLAHSDTIYFLNLGEMYNSSFSKYAAMVGATKFERIEAC